jgi:hypothetical protein
LLGARLRGGDAIDRQEAKLSEESLVVHAAERGVVVDTLGARDLGSEAPDAIHNSARFGARLRNELEVEDHL